MDWKCLDCKAVFKGPKTHTPKGGCSKCHSGHIIDINVRPLTRADFPMQLRDVSGTTRSITSASEF